MRIGLMMGASREIGNDLGGITVFAQQAEAMGFAHVWLAHTMGVDAMTALALTGAQTSRIRMGTAVVPTFPRHPVAMAQQALTAAAARGGRFTLGIGLSHQVLIEDRPGLPTPSRRTTCASTSRCLRPRCAASTATSRASATA